MKKRQHAPDYAKNRTADVIDSGWEAANPNEHWQVNVDITPEGIRNEPAGAFLPQRGRTRPQPHTKINDCDH
jgi:hypothetical protein